MWRRVINYPVRREWTAPKHCLQVLNTLLPRRLTGTQPWLITTARKNTTNTARTQQVRHVTPRWPYQLAPDSRTTVLTLTVTQECRSNSSAYDADDISDDLNEHYNAFKMEYILVKAVGLINSGDRARIITRELYNIMRPVRKTLASVPNVWRNAAPNQYRPIRFGGGHGRTITVHAECNLEKPLAGVSRIDSGRTVPTCQRPFTNLTKYLLPYIAQHRDSARHRVHGSKRVICKKMFNRAREILLYSDSDCLELMFGLLHASILPLAMFELGKPWVLLQVGAPGWRVSIYCVATAVFRTVKRRCKLRIVSVATVANFTLAGMMKGVFIWVGCWCNEPVGTVRVTRESLGGE